MQDNDIILCDGPCNRAYHVQCLVPPVDPEALPEDEGWLCPACDRKVGAAAAARGEGGGGRRGASGLPGLAQLRGEGPVLTCWAEAGRQGGWPWRPRQPSAGGGAHAARCPRCAALRPAPRLVAPPPQCDMVDLINDEFGTEYELETPWETILDPATIPKSPNAAGGARSALCARLVVPPRCHTGPWRERGRGGPRVCFPHPYFTLSGPAGAGANCPTRALPPRCTGAVPGSPRGAVVDLGRLEGLLEGADLPSEDEEDEDYV